MKVLFINETCGITSTGRICAELAEQHEKNGDECMIAYGRDAFVPEKYQHFAKRIGSDLDVRLHGIRTRLLDEHGFGSKQATKEFLKWAEEYDPQQLWLHNLHGYYINVELLFQWIKTRPQMKVKWTLHDCWAFTGHCGFFTMAKCDRWKNGCGSCPQKKDYPASLLIDNSANNFCRKQRAFTGVKNLTLITPSKWLADLTRESFLKDYSVEVQYNTINRDIFKPTRSSFRKDRGLENKKLVLGVANVWHERKGLNDFVRLISLLDDTYTVVLVGLTKKQINLLPQKIDEVAEHPFVLDEPYRETSRTLGGVAIPENVGILWQAITGKQVYEEINGTHARVIALERTDSPQELAGLYSTVDLFVNPTHEDNYPTTNLEAQACGTWVITYDVGGSAETLQ